MFKRLLTEPLVHFLFVAITFFVIYDALNSDEFTAQTITVSEGRIEQIKNQMVEARKREPVKNELDNAIQAYALNEIYLREAKALGLDTGDATINRRLRQKMDFMLEDMASGKEATDIELKTYYQSNKERYRKPATYSFRQAYISVDRPQDELSTLLAKQKQNIANGIAPSGDSSLLPANVTQQTAAQLERNFGKAFTQQLMSPPLQQWFGPVESAMGMHFVLLTQRESRDSKAFEQLSTRVRSNVINDWQRQNVQAYIKQYEKQLLALYRIDIFSPSADGNIK